MREFDMILKVFDNIGDSLSIKTAYSRLIELNKNDPYAKAKAAGSLGGDLSHVLPRQSRESSRRLLFGHSFSSNRKECFP